MEILIKLIGAALILVGGLWIVAAAPNSPIRSEWNPMAQLDPLADPNFLTDYKLRKIGNDPELCQAALLAAQVQFSSQPDRVQGPRCGIENQMHVSRLTKASMHRLETRCDIALRMLMWEAHVVQPAALDIFGAPVSHIDHFGSFTCRAMRTSRGTSARMSEHATANAIDINGFTVGGRNISLIKGWDGLAPDQAFLRRIRDGACPYFKTVLSPDYNTLHHDHFHMDQGRWTSCR